MLTTTGLPDWRRRRTSCQMESDATALPPALHFHFQFVIAFLFMLYFPQQFHCILVNLVVKSGAGA